MKKMQSVDQEKLKENLRGNLRQLRKKAGLTQKELAKFLGISRTAYTYYESGKTLPSGISLYLLTRLYSIRFEMLFRSASRLKEKNREK